MPDERTLSLRLGRFGAKSLRRLGLIDVDGVCRAVRRQKLRTTTSDVDGSVVSTGLQAEWAQRGYKPRQRKVPNYHPILVHLAETTQVVRPENAIFRLQRRSR